MPLAREDLIARLDDLGIVHETIEHPPVFTVEEAQAHTAHLPGGHCKSLFLKDKKGGLWLLVCLDRRRIDMNRLSKVLGCPRPGGPLGRAPSVLHAPVACLVLHPGLGPVTLRCRLRPTGVRALGGGVLGESMSTTRRDFLARATAAGAALALPPTVACRPVEDEGGHTDSDTDVDDGLPRYAYEGPLGPEHTFEHGVASGDPLADAVLLWTRVTTDTGEDAEVFLEIAKDPDFTRRLAAATHTALASRDHCLTVDATELPPGTTLYYRFSAYGRTSPTGRTRTAPTGASDRLRIGACSCSNYAYGYFHAYRALAERPDLDLVLHLGDYVYEYANEGFGETYGTARELDPPNEMVTTEDYRRRYACYRKDPDLQAVHRQHPFVHLWDDHEFACDPFVGGADNHQEMTEGPWRDRVDTAVAVYLEWMPTRLVGTQIHRSLAFGDLAQVILLDRQRRFLWPEDDDEGYLGTAQAQWADEAIADVRAQWLILGVATTFGSRSEDGVGGSSWDVASRTRVLDAVADAGIQDLIVLTGDIHRFDALDLVTDPETYAPGTGTGSAGSEITVGSISSPGGSRDTSGIPQYHWSMGLMRGFVVVELTPERAQIDAFGFADLLKFDEDYPAIGWIRSFEQTAGSRYLSEVDSELPERPDASDPAP